MGLDIILFQTEKGGNPDIVRESQRRRYAKIELVDEVVAQVDKYKKAQHQQQLLNTDVNKLKKSNGQLYPQVKALEAELAKNKTPEKEAELKKLQDSITANNASAKAMDEKIAEQDKIVNELEAQCEKLILSVGNIVHESVPVSDNEDNNVVHRVIGTKREQTGLLHHHEVLHRLHLADLERGVGVAGHRAYFLRGMGVKLNQALINYGLDFLEARGYTQLQTPFFMNQDAMAKTCQLASEADENLYKLTGENAYLIATSEQPISAFHQNEWIMESELPIRYAGYSTCFRKEAGAHGRDVWGIFRVHQFEKIEQFILSTPEQSYEILEQMVKTSEEFFQSLGLCYRVVSIVSKELNAAASKKYDIEAWFPARADFRELVSASNCTDYQSRALGVRCGQKTEKGGPKRFVHMLNGTLCATERTMCCLLENFQDEKGFVIPQVLRPYLQNKERIDFVRELPKKKKDEK